MADFESTVIKQDGNVVIDTSDNASQVTVDAGTDDAQFVTSLKLKNTTSLSNYQATSEKGNANGYASLDGGGKVPASELPTQLMEFLGNWDASTNTPTLANTDTDKQGSTYRVSVAGTVDFGAGNITFAVGDWVFNNGTIWDKGDNTDAVASVFSRTGVVTAQSGDYTAAQVTNAFDKTVDDTDDITEGATNLFNQTHTGDVTGATALTIADEAVTNAKLAHVATDTFKGRTTAATGDVEDLTVAQAKTMLDLAGLNNGDVTLSGTPDYITLVGQDIVRGQVDMTTDITGVTPVANGGTGSATQNFVDLTTAQDVAGVKTMTSNFLVKEGVGAAITASTAADNFVFTSDQTNAGMTLAAPAGGNANVFFAEFGNSNKAAHIQFIGSVNEIRMGAGNVNSLRVFSNKIMADVPLRFNNLTEAARDALTPETGWMIYNTDSDQIEYYEGGFWTATGAKTRVTVADADKTIAIGETLIAYTSITVDRTATLPSAATANVGQVYTVKDESGSVGGGTDIIVDSASGNIDGAASQSITAAYGSLSAYSNGTNWFKV